MTRALSICTGASPVDPRPVGQVRSAFDNIDQSYKFTPEQRATTKAKILEGLTPEEHAAVDAALNPKAAAEAPPVTGAPPEAAAAAPVAPPAAAAAPTAGMPHAETLHKVFQMVSIEHTIGLTEEQKGKMQGEILASMPPEKHQAVIDLFQQAHNNAAELDRLRSLAPETAVAMWPEFYARLGEIIDKLQGLDPKPAAKAASFQPFSDMNHQLLSLLPFLRLPLLLASALLPFLRIPLLLVSAFLTPFVVAAIHMLSFPQSLWSTAFDAQAKIFPVIAMTYFSTVVAAILPYAIRGINTIDGGSGRWEEGPEAPAMVVVLTSFLILPLIAVFAPDDSAYQGPYASRESFCLTFIALWLVHGAINFFHIVYERHEETASKANAQA